MVDSEKHTALYDEHVKLGGRLVPFAGFVLPIQYAGIRQEHEAVRTQAGIFDVSHMGELLIRGGHAVDDVNRLVTNDVARLVDGQALYTCCCNAAGTILDDLIIYRRRQTEVLVVCNASNREKIAAHFQKQLPAGCFEDQSDVTALIALQGPRALDILRRARVELPDSEMPKPFRFVDGSLAGVRCTLARTGYTGEDGVEIFCASADSPAIWRTLLEHGTEAAGLGARDTLRLEARLSLYGNDIDETTNPLEAGLAWTVKLEKSDFIGKQALLAIKAEGLKRKLVGFEVFGRGIARHGYNLLDQTGKVVGICTSGSPAPTLGKNIGLGYLPCAMAEIGSEFLVDCRGKSVEARVVETPFYRRPKSS